MRIHFGTDGWRGVIAKDFTFDNLSLVAQATMDYLHARGLAEKGLVIGYDRRFLSRFFAERVAEVAAGNGVRVRLADGYAPTPAISWAVRESGAGGGIMITASHNPPEYNGFKFKECFGGPARPSTTEKLEEMVVHNISTGRRTSEVELDEAVSDGRITYFDAGGAYCSQLARYVDLERIRAAAIPFIVDPMYGAGSGIFAKLLPGSAEIHAEENPCFGGVPPEPKPCNLSELSALVKGGPFRVGLALDGDADRIGAVDENGDFFSPQMIFAVILRHLHERRGMRGGVVKTVSTTRMVDLLCDRYGLELFETPIGFKHICELMLDHDILMGGEEAGGLGVKGHIPERDGILMGLLLLEAMAMTGKGLRQLLDEVMEETGTFHYRRIDIPIGNQARERLVEQLAARGLQRIGSRDVARGNFLDGFKYIFTDGSWLLVRPSGTEPLLRLYSEAESPEIVEELLRAGREIAGV
ncbi:MAG: phosphoglucomutase/phosphomannomutase family protein [Geobacteraceae bacterium]|nr:phosphoglucomutase/phosphomannomutase family protein [Geobacteraceae bacterium]